jgi:hypothetical protein
MAKSLPPMRRKLGARDKQHNNVMQAKRGI